MADSVRKTIYDAIVTALDNSTEFAHVTRKLEPWWDWSANKFPGLCVLDGDETKKRLAFLHASAGDMYSEVDFRIIGYERDMNNDLDSKRSNIIQQIEIVLQASTALNDLTMDIVPVSVKTDNGQLENFTVTESLFRAKYQYNHASP